MSPPPLLQRYNTWSTLERLGSFINIDEPTVHEPNKTVEDTLPIVANCLVNQDGISEVVLDVETLNGIPVDAMIMLIKFETMVASLYPAVKVHNRQRSMYGTLHIETIFKPVLHGCMCKGICSAMDVPGCIRILSNCLSRALFVHHTCVPLIYVQFLQCFNNCVSNNYVATEDEDIHKAIRLSAQRRMEHFLRTLNNEMYNWRGYVMKPMPKCAPFSLYEMDSTNSRYTLQQMRAHHHTVTSAPGLWTILNGCLCASRRGNKQDGDIAHDTRIF
jgi:hypothetical protein